MKVVTYQTTRDERIDICPSCEGRLKAAHEWPRGRYGDEYAQVHYGLHEGDCDMHQAEQGDGA